jgi:hypothetical protein
MAADVWKRRLVLNLVVILAVGLALAIASAADGFILGVLAGACAVGLVSLVLVRALLRKLRARAGHAG